MHVPTPRLLALLGIEVQPDEPASADPAPAVSLN